MLAFGYVGVAAASLAIWRYRKGQSYDPGVHAMQQLFLVSALGSSLLSIVPVFLAVGASGDIHFYYQLITLIALVLSSGGTLAAFLADVEEL